MLSSGRPARYNSIVPQEGLLPKVIVLYDKAYTPKKETQIGSKNWVNLNFLGRLYINDNSS